MMAEAVVNEGKKIGLNIGLNVENNWRDDTEITTGGWTVEIVEVDDFCHLGSFKFVISNISCDKDCQIKIGKANSVFERLKPV